MNNDLLPLVSIIIPCYNSSRFIETTINSIVKQSYLNWELILVDDGSMDKTWKLLLNASQHNKIFCYKRDRLPKNANTCRNIGFEKSAGDYILFLDSDDILEVNCLENRMRAITSDSNLQFVAVKMGRISTEGKLIKSQKIRYSKNHLGNFIAQNCIWNIASPLYRRSIIDAVDGFNEDFYRLQDVELAFRILSRQNTKYLFLDNSEPDCYYRQGTRAKDEKFYKEYFMHFFNYIEIVLKWIHENDCKKK